MYSIHVIQGFDQGTRQEVVGAVYRIGRDSGNELQLHDSEVSRFHAELRIQQDVVTLADLDSSNGMFVNGEQVVQTQLASGDRIQLGKTHIVFHNSAHVLEDDLSAQIQFGDNAAVESKIIRSALSEVTGSVAVASNSPGDIQAIQSHLQVMYQTTVAVSQTLDLELLLERVLSLIFEWVEADRGCIILMDQRSGELIPKSRRDRDDAKDPEKLIISRRILDYVMEKGEGVITTNAQVDERWEATASIIVNEVNEAICVPLTGRYGVVGAIYIDTSRPDQKRVLGEQQRRFSDEHLKMMIAIGHQAALAVEDTYYYQAMLQSEKLAAMGETVTSIAHHIKNILQGIKGGSYLVEDGLKENNQEVFAKGWQIVQRNQMHISDLVMDMLSYSKDRVPHLQRANLQHVVEDVVNMIRPQAALQGVLLRWESDSPIDGNEFDVQAIHRALLNVVANGVDACGDREGGEVFITISRQETRQCVQVADNGHGISADRLESIFTAFVSGKGSQGTGLGLAVSRKVMREHGGDLTVESVEGDGAVFTLALPLVEDSAGATEGEEAEMLRTGVTPPKNSRE